VPHRELHVPKHRGTELEPALRRGGKKSVFLASVAVAMTALAVSSGLVMNSAAPSDAAAAALASAKADRQDASVPVDLTERANAASRSARRTSIDRHRQSSLNQDSGGQTTKTENLSSTDPRDIARAMLPEFGYPESEFSCLDSLFGGESGWNVHADNPTSSAYGIPQALPGSKMSSAGPDWENNATTQIRWGLGYINGRYGSPCSALSFKESNGWY
jgi:hypothetical protein